MRKILLSWFVAVLAAVGWGRVPAQPEVLEVARHLVAKASFQNLLPGRTVESVAWVALEDDCGVWAAALAPGGHLILSASTKYRALISWSADSFALPDRASPQYALLLFAAQRAAAAEAGDGEDHPSWTVDTGRTASFLSSVSTLVPSTILHAPVDTTSWAQTGVMAWYAPGTAPSGCVATATAQVMHALRWPVYAEGFLEADLSYTDAANAVSTETYAFTPYSKFDYSVMADELSSTDPYARNQQVARLVLLNDILARMGFKSGESGAIGSWASATPWTSETDARKLVGAKTTYTDDDLAAIEASMAAKVPIAATIPGHEIYASGYAVHDAEPYVRLNYGWGGYGNGWYHVDNTSEYLITYPLRTVQCDPLPAVASATPKLSWHLPACYDDKVSGFTVTATEIPEAASSGKMWSDSFTSQLGVKTGNRQALHVGGGQLQVSLSGSGSDAPKALYTWDPIFVPTARTVWSFYTKCTTARGPVHLQVLPLGGVWETVKVIDPGNEGSTGWEYATVDLSDYAGQPIQLRLFAYPTFYRNRCFYDTVTFAMSTMQLTGLGEILTAPAVTETVSGASVRDYTFPAGKLTAGKRYAFAVTPIFTDGGEEPIASTPCCTRIATGTLPAETYASMTFTSPSDEAWQISSMTMDDNTFRYCTWTGLSVIRLATDASVETVELYSSHPDSYPAEAFSIESAGEGLYDIIINSAAFPTEPRVNDRLNLTVCALSAQGTRTTRELSLQFTDNTAFAVSETVPYEGFDYPTELYAEMTEGTQTLAELTWSDAAGAVYDPAEIKWPFVSTLYLTVSGGTLLLDEAASFGGVLSLDADASIQLTHADGLGNLTLIGAGTLRCENVFPAKRGGLTENLWRGTVELAGNIRLADQYVSLEALGNANSRLLVSGDITGYLAKNKTCDIPLELNGSITVGNGYTNGWYIFSKLTGSGSFTHNKNLPYTIAFTDAAGFRGALEVAQAKACLVIGNTDGAVEGAIVVSAGKTAHIASGTSWTTSSDFIVKGTLQGSGTVESDLTFASGAQLDVTQGTLTVTGAVTATDLAVTVDETTYGLILAAENLGASTFTPSDGTALLLTDADGLIRTTRLVQVTRADGTEAVSSAAAEAIARKAAAAGVYAFTLDAASADPDGAVLFDHVISVSPALTRDAASGVVTVAYDFGIQSLTARELTTADGVSADGLYLLVTAAVKTGDGQRPADYAGGTAVELLLNGSPVSEVTVLPTETAGERLFAIAYDTLTPPAGEAQALKFTVRAVDVDR